MKKPKEDILNDVKICIDEIGLNDADFIGSQDNVEMDTIISSKIMDALRYVQGNADWSLLEPDLFIDRETEGVTVYEGIGKIILPDNFMRLCYARFSSWPLFLSEPIYWNDKEYATLSDPYATGTWERPKIAMTMHKKRTLELYKAKDEKDEIEVGIIIEPVLTEEGEVNISEKLYIALVYYIAGLTLLTYNDPHADDMINQALVLMGVNPTKEVPATE